eukprot:NODE_6452_length_1671_cov_5.626295.p1 GENE.NODE_6452_length_1671_cov_5.626295~~NODE_6452_length_1671_cov_5.626295.p1  ORF type:complete len:456 (-),score=122.59 NODE_6452_length_1671_cov_5.626295:228-1595(-)
MMRGNSLIGGNAAAVRHEPMPLQAGGGAEGANGFAVGLQSAQTGELRDWRELFQATWLPEGWREPGDDDDALKTKFVRELLSVLDVETCLTLLTALKEDKSDGDAVCNGLPNNAMDPPRDPGPGQLQATTKPKQEPAERQQQQQQQRQPRQAPQVQQPQHVQPEATFTTVAVRNMHKDFDQASVEAWVNAAGFQKSYDFLLWFPARMSPPQRDYSYAFINFKAPCFASKFQRTFHGKRSEPPTDKDADGGTEGKLPLNVAWAKVQGFGANFRKFRHLSGKQTNLAPAPATKCHPYFCQEAIRCIEYDTHNDVEIDTASAAEASSLPESGNTTVVIRNLPPSITEQKGAVKFLNDVGFDGKYNFFLFIPAKTKRCGSTPNYPYVFANFITPEVAKECMERFQGHVIGGDLQLNLVFANKTQGLEACKTRFGSMSAGSRCKPWLQGENDKAVHTAFQ